MTFMDKPSSESLEAMDNTDDLDHDELMEDDVEETIDDNSPEIVYAASPFLYEPDGDDDDDYIEIESIGSDRSLSQLVPGQSTRDDADCVFSKHTGAVFCCNLDPKTNTLAATGSEDDKAYVWNITSGEVLLECTGHHDSVIATEFSHDGTYLATGDMGGIIQVWKIATKTVVWSDCIGDLSWIKWHHGSAVLFAGAASGEIYMWKIPSGVVKLFPSQGISSDCSVIMPDGRRAAFGYSDGSVRVYDLKLCSALVSFSSGEVHNLTIYCMDAHSDNNMIVTGGGDGKVALYKTQPGKVVSVFQDAIDTSSTDSSNSWIEAVRFSPDPCLPYVAAGTLYGKLLIWDLAKQTLRNKIEVGCGISRLAWDKHSSAIYAALLDGSVKIYDARSGTMQSQLFGHKDNILDLSLSHDGGVLLTASEDTTARAFSLSTPDR